MHFGISEGKGGLKHGSRPLLGMDIFWNCPFPRGLVTGIKIMFQNKLYVPVLIEIQFSFSGFQ